MLLKGKNVIITGANRGIGKAAAESFAANGANLWLCARNPSPDFEESIRELSDKTGVRMVPLYFDLQDETAVKEAVRRIAAEKRPVDVLVNNAGMAYGGLFQMTPMEQLKKVFEINYFSQIYLSQLVSRLMVRQKSGCIINMASVGGLEAERGYLAYGSSKAALIYATKTMAKELGEFGIRVNAIAPGLVDTQMGYYKSDEESERVLARTALHRRGNPQEIVDAMLYLASEKASYVTGHVLVVDGGRLR